MTSRWFLCGSEDDCVKHCRCPGLEQGILGGGLGKGGLVPKSEPNPGRIFPKSKSTPFPVTPSA